MTCFLFRLNIFSVEISPCFFFKRALLSHGTFFQFFFVGLENNSHNSLLLTNSLLVVQLLKMPFFGCSLGSLSKNDWCISFKLQIIKNVYVKLTNIINIEKTLVIQLQTKCCPLERLNKFLSEKSKELFLTYTFQCFSILSFF